MMEPTRITLSHPIEAHGETVSEIELREPTLAVLDGVHLVVEQSGAVRIDLGDLHRLIAGMAQIPPSSARQIRLADVGPALDRVMDFLPASRPGGGRR